ncbi:hypothetical protein, partial [Burkholderia sp.]|uniref:hypothetical protein n=1 Tax=Burkholderia sp. TaxID=36773 RepID=UPI00258533A4
MTAFYERAKFAPHDVVNDRNDARGAHSSDQSGSCMNGERSRRWRRRSAAPVMKCLLRRLHALRGGLVLRGLL